MSTLFLNAPTVRQHSTGTQKNARTMFTRCTLARLSPGNQTAFQKISAQNARYLRAN